MSTVPQVIVLRGGCTKMRKPQREIKKNIGDDLSSLNFSDIVIRKASEIYNSLNLTKDPRSNPRKMVNFYCIYYAHKELENEINFSSIAEECGIDQKLARKAISKYGKRNTSDSVDTISTVESSVRMICGIMKMNEEYIDSIISIYENVIADHEDLCDSNPKTVAVVLIYTFFTERNFVVNKDKLLDIAEVSSSSFDRHEKIIMKM